ncbi:MAG TPA: alpha/beta hydrolase [Casimicrobiaceae bacterium]|nr:alpha/beta hydrolase [Casimicrobiaceae bacterium]
MSPGEPYVRSAGTGPGVVCLHANASTSGQWRGLIERLSGRYRVLAPDSYGAGKSPDWPSDRVISLQDEAAFVEPVFAAAGTPFTLVGHSYGAAIALRAALDSPRRVRALAVYEPTLFALIDAESPPPNGADGIRATVAAGVAALEGGNRDAAAERFIDYWMGSGAWRSMPPERKPAIAASVVNMRRWAHALLSERARLADFRALDIPILYMTGKRSPESAREVARLLLSALPRVTVREFEELGHMGPVTHPAQVDEAIATFIDAH